MTVMAPGIRLQQWLDKLDHLLPAVDLQMVLAQWRAMQFTWQDVEPYVRYHPNQYQRILIAYKADYMLVVMCWLPGQSSGCHDHLHSNCILQILKGQAVEYNCVRGADGLVEQTGTSNSYGVGTLVQTAIGGIHTFGNAPESIEPLITMHLYTPPLSSINLYQVRQPEQLLAPVWQRHLPSEGKQRTIAVVGGGFCGTTTIVQLLTSQLAQQGPLRVLWYEPSTLIGPGVAYGVREPTCLLNVPVSKMGALASNPEHFWQWYQQNREEGALPGQFVARQHYGHYLQWLLQSACQAAPAHCSLELVPTEVTSMAARSASQLVVQGRDNAQHVVDGVVLAVGPPRSYLPQQVKWRGSKCRYIADPWSAWAMHAISPDEPVLLLGSGLTAVDIALALLQQARSAPVWLLSRHGCLPTVHGPQQAIPAAISTWYQQWQAPATLPPLKDWLALLRAQIRTSSWPWQLWLDGMRPLTDWLWQHWSLAEQRQFLRHVQTYWDVHRHRMAPEVAGVLHGLLQQGSIEVQAGRLMEIIGQEDGIEARVKDRHTGENRLIHAKWLINCTGFGALERHQPPWLAGLLQANLACIDGLGLGLCTASDGQLQAMPGSKSAPIWLAGSLRRGQQTWETTAVPELRQQVAQLCRGIEQTFAV